MMDIHVEVQDEATPVLRSLVEGLLDRTPLHAAIAPHLERTVRDHLIAIAPTMHKTAEALGATPTGYLTRRANAIESSATSEAAVLTFGGASEIFSRTTGPVVVRPVKAKYLTIPIHRETYGKRMREVSGLKIVYWGRRSLLGVPKEAPRQPSAKKGAELLAWLRQWGRFYLTPDSVLLPEERNLLPRDEDFIAALELGAVDFIEMTQKGGTTA